MIISRCLKLTIKIISLSLIIGLTSSSYLVAQPIFSEDFFKASPKGFGDRWNTAAWSMAEWQGNLYVGTARAVLCQQAASVLFFRPDLGIYPPALEPGLCTPSPQDLPLRAEIWRWRPGEWKWTRVFQSPEDIEIPGHPGKFVARDVGYRSMLVFQEPNGQEALYVAGVSSRSFNELTVDKYLNDPDLPPPRLLRSTDGSTFTPVPQDPGTFLGNLPGINGFRTLTEYNKKLYLVASIGLLGHGALLEASDPAKGNDHFRKVQVTSKDLQVFETAVYNGYLYVGTGGQPINDDPPFTVLKTQAMGALPYTFKEIIPPGAYAPTFVGATAISMHVHEGRLYVGSERELLRINPDDSWDVVVGTPRHTPQGTKFPLSGLDLGFDYVFNIHMWRLASFDGFLYVGTQDQGVRWRIIPPLRFLASGRLGFDLYATQNGYYFSLISQTGFGDRLTNGVRNFAVTPFGFFLGTSSLTRGMRIWRGFPGNRATDRPQKLEADFENGNVILSWEGTEEARKYHIYRDGPVGKFEKIDEVDADTSFYMCQDFQLTAPKVPALDLSEQELRELQALPMIEPSKDVNAQQTREQLQDILESFLRHHYYVVAENAHGELSQPSNVVRVPLRGLEVTFDSLKNNLTMWQAPPGWHIKLHYAHSLVDRSDPKYQTALQVLAQLRQLIIQKAFRLPAPWRSEDLVVLVDKLARRVELAQRELLSPQAVL